MHSEKSPSSKLQEGDEAEFFYIRTYVSYKCVGLRFIQFYYH
jgi:hypothetical protein